MVLLKVPMTKQNEASVLRSTNTLLIILYEILNEFDCLLGDVGQVKQTELTYDRIRLVFLLFEDQNLLYFFL